jgi:hypothetical protein
MNKKAKRRAFFVFVLICLAYGAVAIRLSDRLGVRRVTEGTPGATPSGMHLAVPQRTEATGGADSVLSKQPESTPVNVSQKVERSRRGGTPTLSTAIVWYAIGQRWLEKEDLIPVPHGGAGIIWKRPLDIAREGDDEGLKEIGRMIGKKNLIAFLSREGIAVDTALLPEEIFLGRGVEADRNRVVSLYGKYVPEEWARDSAPTPASTDHHAGRSGDSNDDWMMPNLLNLPLRTALEQLSGHTVRLKVYGSGLVVDQTPRAFERLKGETECIIHGGVGKE